MIAMNSPLFYMGGIELLNSEQRKTAEEFINAQTHCTIATNNPQTGARLSYLGNIPQQTLDRLYFATDAESDKVTNIREDGRFEAAYTDGNSQLFLSGTATVVEDIVLRHEKWKDFMYDYFCDGPDGTHYCLVEFRPEQARIMIVGQILFDPATLREVNIVGIACRTSNAAQQSSRDIAKLWERFWSEDVISEIPHKKCNDIYAVYTGYESDAKGLYTLVIGCPVESLRSIPQGMESVTIQGGNYMKTNIKGKISDGIVEQAWVSVWQAGLDRRYDTDFEYYKCDGFDPDHAEVDIFVGVKK